MGVGAPQTPALPTLMNMSESVLLNSRLKMRTVSSHETHGTDSGIVVLIASTGIALVTVNNAPVEVTDIDVFIGSGIDGPVDPPVGQKRRVVVARGATGPGPSSSC